MTILKTKSAFLLLLIIAACKPDLQAPKPSSGDANFTTPIAIGGSFLSGYSSGTITASSQKNSVANLLAKSFCYTVYEKYDQADFFNQPLMPDGGGLGINSRPWDGPTHGTFYPYTTNFRLGDKTDCLGGVSLAPLKDLLTESDASNFTARVSGSFNDFSIPFINTSQITNPALSGPYSATNRNPYYGRFAASQGSSKLLDEAVAKKPTFSVVWLGMDDIYNYARVGGYNTSIPSTSDFTANLDAAVAALSANGAKGVLANIPDYDMFPFFTYVHNFEATAEKAEEFNQATGSFFNFVEGTNQFILDVPYGSGFYRKLRPEESVLLNVPSDSIKCDPKIGIKVPMPDRYSLDSVEVSNIINATVAYNNAINNVAEKYGWAVADVNGVFKKVKGGTKINGVDYSLTFISGGFLGLDGYHPTEKGYAIIADEFVKAINTKFNSTIPSIYCPTCQGVRFP